MTNEVVQASAEQTQQNAPSEKMVPVSEVNKIVSERYNAGYEKAMQQAQAAQSQQQHAPAYSEEKLERLVEAKVQGLVAQGVANHSVNQFVSKIRAGSGDYPDLEQHVMENADILSPLIPYLNGIGENLPDLVHEILENPSKALLLQLGAVTGKEKAVQKELANIAKSISDNKKALSGNVTSKVPLNQVKPSTSGGDNGSQTISDLRKNPLYKC